MTSRKHRFITDNNINKIPVTHPKSQAPEVSMTPLAEAKMIFDKTGTADIVVSKDNGISIKDEGDFASVRFGSNSLIPIGSALSGERNFATKTGAFDLAKQIQDILARGGQTALPENYNQRHGVPLQIQSFQVPK